MILSPLVDLDIEFQVAMRTDLHYTSYSDETHRNIVVTLVLESTFTQFGPLGQWQG